MKRFDKLLLILFLAIVGCGLEIEKEPESKGDHELEIINTILPHLLPDHPPCGVIMNENESSEDYEVRLQEFYDEIDSVGRKIEIISEMRGLDPRVIKVALESDSSTEMRLWLNASLNDKHIDEALIDEIEGVQIVFIKERKRGAGGFKDCSILGQLSFSRIGFNEDSTQAAIRYLMNNGSCQGEGDIIEVIREGREWKMVEKDTF